MTSKFDNIYKSDLVTNASLALFNTRTFKNTIHPTNSLITKLPPYIIQQILEYVNQFDLINLSLTCSRLYLLAIEKLYKRITIVLEAEFPNKYKGDSHKYIIDNGMKYMDSSLIFKLNNLLKFIITITKNKSIFQLIKYVVFDKSYDTFQGGSDLLIALQCQIMKIFEFSKNLNFLHISFVDFTKGIDKLTKFLSFENVRQKMFKLLITDLNQLNKPFIPPNLTNLFLLLNDHDDDNNNNNNNNNNNANNINNKNTNDLSIKLPPPILRNSLYHSPNVKFDKNLIENSYKLLIRLNDYLNQLINHWPNILNECPKFHDFIYNCNNIIVNNNNNNKGTTPTTIITNETIIKSFYPNSIMINKNIHDNSVTFSKTAPLPKLSTITTKQMSNNIRPTSINISTTKTPTTTSTTNKPVIASSTTSSNRIFRLPDQYINNSTYIDQLSKKIRDNTTINSTSTTTTTAKTNNTKNFDNLSTIVHSESDKSLFSYTSIINTYNNNSNNNNINNIDDDDDDDIASVGLSQSSSEQASSSSNYISDDSILEIQNKEDNNNNNNNDDDKLLDNFSNLLSSSSSFSFRSLLPMTNINNHERINSLLQLDSQRLDNHQRINSIQSEPEESIFDKIPQPQEHYNHNHNHNQHNRYCSSCTTATNHSSKMNSPSTTPLTINSHDESGRGGRGGEKGKGIEVFEKFPASSNIDKPLPLPPSLPSSSSSSSFSSSGCSTKYPMTIIPTATVKSMTINSPMNAITEHTAKTYCCNDLSLLSSPSSPSPPTTRSLSASSSSSCCCCCCSSSSCCRYCSSSSNASFFEISMNNIINELDEFEFAIDDDHQHHQQQQIIDKTTTLDKIEVEVYLNKIGTCGVESTDTDTDLIKFQLFKHDILSIDYLKKIISFKMYNDYELLNHFNLLLIKTDKNIFTNDNDEDEDEDENEDENKLILLDDDKILTNYINQLSIIKLNLIRSRAKRETIS